MKSQRNSYLHKAFLTVLIILLFSCKQRENTFTVITNVGHPNFHLIQQGKVYRIFIIDSQNMEPYTSTRKAFLATLKANGLEINKNLKITLISIGNDIELGKKKLQEHLSAHRYDLIYLNGTVIAEAARGLFLNHKKHQFLFSCVTDPVGLGLIKGFGILPESNFTGVSYPVPVSSRIRFIKSILPGVKKAGLIYADMPQSRSYFKWLNEYIQQQDNINKISIVFRKVPFIKGEDGSGKMALLAKNYIIELNQQVDVYISPNDQMGISPAFLKMVNKFSTKPLIGLSKNDVQNETGATASIFPSLQSIGEQTGTMALKILSGKKVQEIPSEWPGNFGFSFNINKAKKFGAQIPVEFLDIAGDNIVR